MSTLAVRLGACTVGTLEYFEEEEEYRFVFDDGWLGDPQRPVLGQFFEDRRPRPVPYVGPPCWFSHLLPQGPLRRAIARELGVADNAEYALYEFLGGDLPGAILLAPQADASARRAPRRVVREAAENFPWRSALAGMQLKMSVQKRERGVVIPVRGASGDMIAKFHSPDFRDLPRVEHATMSWARAAGIEAPPFELGSISDIGDLPEHTPAGDGRVYLIERFDRRDGGSVRVHFEDFAQVLDRPLTQIYDDPPLKNRHEAIGAVLAALCPEDVRPFIERVVFCALAGNGDAHLKNWALLYPDARRPRLAPAYDLVSTVLYPRHVDDHLALSLNDTCRFEDVRVDSFGPMAHACNLAFDELKGWVLEAAARTRSIWASQRAQLGYTAAEMARIDWHLARVPLT